jgi:uncharacterized protein YjbJ (UPF0337 family)
MADLKTEGRWDQIKGKARSIWGDLTDDDFDKARGDTQTLIGRIKEKTGETSEDIQRKLGDILDDDVSESDRDTNVR